VLCDVWDALTHDGEEAKIVREDGFPFLSPIQLVFQQNKGQNDENVIIRVHHTHYTYTSIQLIRK